MPDTELHQAMALIQQQCFQANRDAGWHHDIRTGLLRTPEQDNDMFAGRIALCHSELSEALEGHRKGLMDDKLKRRRMAEVELADAVIRICDLAGIMGYDLAGALVEKMAFNAQRADHKLEHRLADGGKKY